MEEECIRVGIFTSTHGLKGEIKVFPTTDDPQRFLDLQEVLLVLGEKQIRFPIERVRFFKNQVILKGIGFDSIDAVEPWKGADLMISRDRAVPLAEGEYFAFELIDARVVTEDGASLGTIQEILFTGANDVYVVKNQAGREILLPAIPSCILSVDPKAKLVTVHLLPGLLE